jgi:mannosyltransferase OCH1-like enzyme
MTIPKKIMQFWDAHTLPADILPLTESWKKLNPNFDYQLFDDASARTYIEAHFSPAHIKAFDNCALPAMRSDFFRYAYIYQDGGVYSDAGISCAISLEQWLDFDQPLIFVRKTFKDGRPDRIMNGFIAASPKNNLLKMALDECIKNINEKKLKNIWRVTGPGIINAIVNDGSTEPLTELDFDFFKTNCYIHSNLQHKKTAHWSMQQNEQSIYSDDPLSTHQPTTNNDDAA